MAQVTDLRQRGGLIHEKAPDFSEASICFQNTFSKESNSCSGISVFLYDV